MPGERLSPQNGIDSGNIRREAQIPYDAGRVSDYLKKNVSSSELRNNSSRTASLGTLMNMLDGLYAPGMQNSMGIGGLQKYIGITEGSDPEQITEFHKAAGLTAGPETPWCMSFVQHVLRNDMGLTDAQIGAPTASAADGLKMGQPVAQPSPGDIVVVPGEGPSGKHIGICSGPGKYISGNTGNKVAEKPIPGGAEYRHIGGGAGANMGGQQIAA